MEPLALSLVKMRHALLSSQLTDFSSSDQHEYIQVEQKNY